MSRPAHFIKHNQPRITTHDAKPLPQFVEVAVPVRVQRTYTYRLPLALQSEARIGARLLVPFQNKLVTAYIVALHETLDESIEIDQSEIKEAEELLDAEPLFTPEVLDLTKWISDYYLASWGEVLKAALPAGLNQTIEQILTVTSEGRDELARLLEHHPADKPLTGVRARVLRVVHEHTTLSFRSLKRMFDAKESESVTRAVRKLEKQGWLARHAQAQTAQAKPKRRKAIRLLPPEHHETDAAKTLSEAAQRVIDSLINAGGEMGFTDLLADANVSPGVLQTLERRKLIEVFAQPVRRDPLAHATLPEATNFELTAIQQAAFDEIKTAIDAESYKAFLLHGVTGSGKTEIYIRAMHTALSQDKSSLMLVPEIALTPVFSRRLRVHFGDAVAIFHSSLSVGERFDEWTRLKQGLARIVIGTRSAVFAPVKNLGVVIVDEEHEASYRQQEAPYYSGREAAIMRAHKENAVVILGSATPSLETFRNAETAKYRYLSLPDRIMSRPMAQAELVDMRGVLMTGGRSEVFSDELLNAIDETHRRGEQTIILLNRRGYSSFVICRACGERVQCPNCDVTLTFHKQQRTLICHYCDFRGRVPDACPSCKSPYLFFLGEGTEQIEDILSKKFPTLRIARLDRDATRAKGFFEITLSRFSDGEIDLLVGTQMIAKGHDYPNVTLVGVVSTDTALALPDFRAAERTFQLITQVAGRAGRGDKRGRVLIQTFMPEHYALRHAANQDYKSFYREEINYRRNLKYPPFVALAALLIHHQDLTRVQTSAYGLRDALDKHNHERRCRILGPAPAPLARLRNEHRMQLLIKGTSRTHIRTLLDMALADSPGIIWRDINIEIDPVNLM